MTTKQTTTTKRPEKSQAQQIRQAERRFERYEQRSLEMTAEREKQYPRSFWWSEFTIAELIHRMITPRHDHS